MKNKRLIYIIIGVAFVLILLFLDLNLSKTLEIKTDFEKATPFFTILTPEARIKEKRIILSEPIYFKTFLPGVYDQADLTLDLDNPKNISIKVGLWIDDKPYDLQEYQA